MLEYLGKVDALGLKMKEVLMEKLNSARISANLYYFFDVIKFTGIWGEIICKDPLRSRKLGRSISLYKKKWYLSRQCTILAWQISSICLRLGKMREREKSMGVLFNFKPLLFGINGINIVIAYFFLK